MKKALIIGGGFAGLAALRRFVFYQRFIQVTLISCRFCRVQSAEGLGRSF